MCVKWATDEVHDVHLLSFHHHPIFSISTLTTMQKNNMRLGGDSMSIQLQAGIQKNVFKGKGKIIWRKYDDDD